MRRCSRKSNSAIIEALKQQAGFSGRLQDLHRGPVKMSCEQRSGSLAGDPGWFSEELSAGEDQGRALSWGTMCASEEAG